MWWCWTMTQLVSETPSAWGKQGVGPEGGKGAAGAGLCGWDVLYCPPAHAVLQGPTSLQGFKRALFMCVAACTQAKHQASGVHVLCWCQPRSFDAALRGPVVLLRREAGDPHVWGSERQRGQAAGGGEDGGGGPRGARPGAAPLWRPHQGVGRVCGCGAGRGWEGVDAKHDLRFCKGGATAAGMPFCFRCEPCSGQPVGGARDL
jgi:hypothetical protein